MSVLVVGSVALDSVKTPFGQVDDVLGGAASYFALAASTFTDVRLVGVIGADFPRAAHRVVRHATDRPGRVAACPERRHVSLGRALRLRPERRAHARYPTERLCRLRSAVARGVSRQRVRLPGQYRARAAVERARTGAQAEVRRARLDELLDRQSRYQKGPREGDRAGRRGVHERRRDSSVHRHISLAPGGARDPVGRAEGGADQEGRARCAGGVEGRRVRGGRLPARRRQGPNRRRRLVRRRVHGSPGRDWRHLVGRHSPRHGVRQRGRQLRRRGLQRAAPDIAQHARRCATACSCCAK